MFDSFQTGYKIKVSMACLKVIEHTVWICQDFFVTQILREINFAELISSNTAIFAILGALTRAKIHKNENLE